IWLFGIQYAMLKFQAKSVTAAKSPHIQWMESSEQEWSNEVDSSTKSASPTQKVICHVFRPLTCLIIQTGKSNSGNSGVKSISFQFRTLTGSKVTDFFSGTVAGCD